MIIFELNHNNFTNFIKILFLVSLLVLFDSFIQYTLGQNLFGNEYIDNRLTSVFGDEKVVGAFLTKIAFLVLIFPFLIFKRVKIFKHHSFFLKHNFFSNSYIKWRKNGFFIIYYGFNSVLFI